MLALNDHHNHHGTLGNKLRERKDDQLGGNEQRWREGEKESEELGTTQYAAI